MKNRLLLTVMCFLSVLCMKAEDVVFVVDGIKYSTGIEYDKDRPAEGIGVKVYADETLYKELTEVVIPDEVTYGDVTYKVVELGSNLNFNGASSKVQKLTIGANVKTIVSPLGKDNLKAIRFMGSEAPTINTETSGSVTWSGITAIAPNGVLSAYQTAYNTIGFKSVVDDNSLHAKSIAVSPVGNLHVGDAKDIVYEIVKFDPSDATPLQVNWTSSNTSVATVDANGHIEALAEGTTTITGQTNDAGWAITSFEVTVGPDLALVTTDLSICRREGRTLRLTGTPMGTVTFESSAPDIVHVDDEGHVSGIKAGSATITIKDGEAIVGTCVVEVSSNLFEGFDNTFCTHYIDGIWYRISAPNATVTFKGARESAYGNEYSGNVVVPASVSYNGTTYNVTGICANAFYGCPEIESMTLPFVGGSATATNASDATLFGYIFGRNSYDGAVSCSQRSYSSAKVPTYLPAGLKSVTITGGEIFTDAFSGCNIEEINITGNVESIGNYAFCNCWSLKNISLPNSVTTIGSSAFSSCSGLTSVTIPNSVTSIGGGAFSYCSGLTSVTIPNSVTSIGSRAFYGCSSLTELSIPNSVLTIGDNAFAGCNSLVDLEISANVESMGTSALNAEIQRVTMRGLTPPSLTSITNFISPITVVFVDPSAYDAYVTHEQWKNFKSQIIAIGTKTDYAVNVNALEMGSAVHQAIGEANLSKVISLKVTGTINSYDIMIINSKMPCLRSLDLSEAKILTNSYEYYTGYSSIEDTWTRYSFNPNLTELILPNTLKTINTYLDYMPYLKEIVIPASVTEIKSLCNSVNQKIEKIVFTEDSKLTSVGQTAFGSDYLKYIVGFEHTQVTELYHQMFRKGLKEIVIPASVTTMTGDPFVYASSLQSLTFADGDEKLVVARGFNILDTECSNLSSVYVGRNIDGIGFYGFSNPIQIQFNDNLEQIPTINLCSGLKEIQLPSNLTFISKLVGGFTSIVIPASVVEIHAEAFSGSQQLKECVFAANSKLETIGRSAFRNCYYLERIGEFPNLKTIEEQAFYNCALTSINFPTTLTSIGNQAFYNNSKLAAVKLPSSLKNIGTQAFAGCTGLMDVYTYTAEPQEINTNTFSDATYTVATLHVPSFSYYNYYWDTGWNKFLSLADFDEPYDYLFLDKDLELNESTGIIKGEPIADMNAGSGIIVNDLTQNFDDVHIKFDGNTNTGASLIGKVKANKIYLDLEVKANFWYAFCFPFNVDLKTIQKSGGYVFRYYDGQKRANGGSGWSEIAAGTEHLNAGEGYIFRTNEAGTLTIVVDKKTIEAYDLTVDKLTALNSYTATSGTTTDDNKSWNFVGNPYLSYFDMNDLGYTAPVVTFNGTTYEALRPGDDEQVFYPFQAFFVQKPENVDGVGFGAADQTTYIKSQNAQKKAQARARKADALNLSRKLINLTLTDGTVIDKTRVVFNDEQKMTYEAECDAAKFSSEGVPQFFSLDAKGTKYAINERPMADGVVKLGFTAPAPGEYTISATRMDAHVFLKDNQTGRMHDLSEGDYTFTASKGSDVKRFELVAADEETAIGRVDDDSNADEAAYDLNGRRVGKTQKGVNIVNGKKVMVK